ncbi:hypothetical protein CWC42_23730 [Klebsiella aerogenes]|nr:hypothetical protein CWC42_23730 [Klebsiella aerogenes]
MGGWGGGVWGGWGGRGGGGGGRALSFALLALNANHEILLVSAVMNGIGGAPVADSRALG